MKKVTKADDIVSSGRRDWVYLAVLLTATIAVMTPSLSGEFLNWDDDRFIVNNTAVSSLTIDHVVDAFDGLHFESYQPLHLLSYMVDGTLWHLRAPMYRLHNLALYLAAVGLLYFWLRRLGCTSFASFVGVLFFAAAPYRVESVCWISARKDVLMLVFFFGAWHLHLTADSHPQHAVRLRAMAAALFVSALLSKSSALVLPLMMLVLDVGIRRKPVRSAMLCVSVYAAFAAVVGVALPFIWSDASLIQKDAAQVGNRAALVVWTIVHYLKTSALPFHLSPLYAAPDTSDIQQSTVLFAAFLVSVICAGLYCRVKRVSLVPFATVTAMFFVALAPFLNFVPLYYFRADRYLLLPSAALALGVALTIEYTLKKRSLFMRLTAAVLFVFVIAMGGAAAMESAHWRTSLHLWQHAVDRAPSSYYARLKLGETYRNLDRFQESERQYRAALRLKALSPTAFGGVFWAALLQDMTDTESSDRAAAEKLAHYFVSVANDGEKLSAFGRYLKQRGFKRAANVVAERFSR